MVLCYRKPQLTFIFYLQSLGYKQIQQLGFWDDNLCESMFVKGLGHQFDHDKEDDEENHQEVISIIGHSHSLFWQFIPLGTIIAKFAEALNESPAFVFASNIHVPEGER